MSDTAQAMQQLFANGCITNSNSYTQHVFSQMARCHTAEMGRHTYCCDNASCAYVHYQYHSCGNRHCMFCGMFRRGQWMEDEMRTLLPTAYYHVVFTVPHQLNSLIMGNRVAMFSLLFNASHHALLTLGKDKKYLGATPGITSVLHTWGQQLSFHPHVHCIVSGGGADENNNWVKAKRANNKFLFPTAALMKLYRGYFLSELQKMLRKYKIRCEGIDVQSIIDELYNIKWNVNARAPFAGPQQVIAYLGLYTNKVAISKNRIISVDDDAVTFKYKDYADGKKEKVMTLNCEEFLRRLEQHILPKRFVKIRHAGYLQNRGKQQRLQQLHANLLLPPMPPKVRVPVAIRILEAFNVDVLQCPKCKTGNMMLTNTTRRQTFIPVTIRNKDDPDITLNINALSCTTHV